MRHVKAGHRHLVPGGRQFRRGRIKLGCVAAVEDDFGAVFGKALREREPDALRRAGDERPLARQFEQFKCHLATPYWLRARKFSSAERLQRQRQTLQFETPSERFNAGVASTG